MFYDKAKLIEGSLVTLSAGLCRMDLAKAMLMAMASML